MTEEEVNTMLQDPFAKLILQHGNFPLTANHLIQALQNTRERADGLEALHSFVVAEGGQIKWNEETQHINRTVRFAFAMKTKGGIGPDILVTTGTSLDSGTQFLQLMSWDPVNRAYNFYQRLRIFWIWSGSSFDAFSDQSRGKGPFSGHTNGGPIMKELRVPWQHWHSMSAKIKKEALNPSDPILATPHFERREGGDVFEDFIKTGIGHWNDSRISRLLSARILYIKPFIRQFLTTTNVNLRSSRDPSHSVAGFSDIALPFSFFANVEAFSKVGVEPDVESVKVSRVIYLENLRRFEFALESDGVKIKGDTHFAFLVPEPAAEDIDLLGKIIQHRVTTKRFMACLLMVDFANPIYSPSRASLMRFMPDAILRDSDLGLEEGFLENIQKSGRHRDPNTPEGEFFSYWNLGPDQWKEVFEKMISKYFQLVSQRCQSQEGYDQIVQLAESRRYEFKKTAQFEFPLTFATTNIPKEMFPLEMAKEGIVRRVI